MVAAYQILLLGLAASFASAAPVKGSGTPGTVYRGDNRSRGTIEDQGGFSTWANTNKKPENMDLKSHAGLPNPNPAARNDGYVSTSSSKQVAQDFAPDGNVYSIATKPGPPGYTDVNKALGNKAPVPFEKEQAARGSIPSSAITQVDKMKGGEVVDSKPMAPQSPSRW
ncbi:hypothetical protein CAC42_5768 [Sphaceloma murrayae]|uniref:Uncharacterized protein n=1 Tax=Sphaceloma murrayae TaxID=2082308 RepID=A0A2K1QZ52_9PEZI|nr:hypothetical protein CAC42_5768 [Sphaceloma murrayae]